MLGNSFLNSFNSEVPTEYSFQVGVTKVIPTYSHDPFEKPDPSCSAGGSFQTEEELKEILENKIKLFLDSTKYAQRYFFKVTYNLPEPFKDFFKKEFSQTLLELFLNAPQLCQVDGPSWFLNEEQNQSLRQHLQKNQETKKQQEEKHREAIHRQAIELINRKKREYIAKNSLLFRRNYSIAKMLGTLLGATALWSVPLALTTPWTVGLAGLGGILGYKLGASIYATAFTWHARLITKAEKAYTPEKIQNTTQPGEKAALQIGVHASENWWNYGKSFVQWPAYRHYQAFTCGKISAEKDNTKVLEEIRKIRPE